MYSNLYQSYDGNFRWDFLLKMITNIGFIVKNSVTALFNEFLSIDIQQLFLKSSCKCLFFQIEALPEVVEAVGRKMDVFVDGGIRKGTDVFKALAMGAKAVFIGRPVLWGLAYNVSFYFLFNKGHQYQRK